MNELRVPHHVRASDAPHGGTVLLNMRSGQWYALNSTGHTLWQEWHRTGDFDTAVRTLTHRHPGLPGDQLHADADQLASALVARGLLTRGRGTGQRPPRTPIALPCARKDDVPLRGPHPAFSHLALLAALLLLRLPFPWTIRIVTALGDRWCRHTATAAQAQRAIAAVRAAARHYPGRAACLELTLGAVMVMTFFRRRIDWCIGMADDPYRFHAWIEVAGNPVPDPADTPGEIFRRFLVM